MPLWAWLLIAVGSGVLIGVEAYAWMGHRSSAIFLAGVGLGSLAAGLVALSIVATIAYGMFAGVTGIDPLGFDSTSSTSSSPADRCDSNYEGACVPTDRGDVDCGDLAETDIRVVGDDVDGLDRDGNGIGCQS